MKRRVLMFFALSLALSAASACSGKAARLASASATSTPTSAALAPTAELPPQTLAPDECAMFLWTATEPRRFIFFSKAQSGQGKLSLQGTETPLTQRSAGGDLFGQFMTDTVFDSAGQTVTVSVVPGDEIEDGQRVASGKIILRDADGWETIMPVLGLRACQPNAS